MPNNWDICTLEQLALVERGKFSARPRNDPQFYGGDIPFVQTGDIASAGVYLTSFSQTLNNEGLKVSKLFPRGTILVTIAANIGDTAITTFDLACPDSVVAIQAYSEKADVFWLKKTLETRKADLDAKATQNAQKNINLQVLKPLQIKTPPLAEQRKIAQFLSTWHKAIVTLEKLIGTARQQKTALMQQLLTGKKRFAEFEDEWEDRFLNEVAQVIVSPVDKKTIDGEIPVELCNYTDVYYRNTITRKINFMKATAKQSEIDKYTLKVGDVIITKDSETPGDIAVPALVSEDLNGVVCGYHLAIVRPQSKLVDGAFVNYLFTMQKTRYYFFTLATGATRFGLSIGGINKAHFKLPSLIEQRKIASVLSAADQEIETLEQKLAHLKQEEKALMRQLLTGERRVKLDATELEAISA